MTTPGAMCASGGGGNIVDVMTIRASGPLTHTMATTIDPGATGTLSNTAQVLLPDSAADLSLASNMSTISNSLTPEADLSVAKTNADTGVTAGLGTN